MNVFVIIILLVSTVSGWLISRIAVGLIFYPVQPKHFLGITLQGIWPKHKHVIITHAIETLSKELFSKKAIQEKFLSAGHVDALLPEIEAHIDDFLRHRLGKKMPMIGMFIGENTIRQLKEVFMEELKEILPVVMNSYLAGVVKQDALAEALGGELRSIRMAELQSLIRRSLSPDLRLIGYTGAAIGFIFGLIHVLVVVFAGYQ